MLLYAQIATLGTKVFFPTTQPTLQAFTNKACHKEDFSGKKNTEVMLKDASFLQLDGNVFETVKYIIFI